MQRRERLESIEARPGPETRPALAPKLDAAETAAATGAAILGMFYSTSNNTVLEVGPNHQPDRPIILGPLPAERAPMPGTTVGQPDDPKPLVPWVRLGR